VATDSYLHVNILKCCGSNHHTGDVSKIPIEGVTILTIVLISKSKLERAVLKKVSANFVSWSFMDTYLYVSV
jgi:hypothetical protein